MSNICWFLFNESMYGELASLTDDICKLSSGCQEIIFLFSSNSVVSVPLDIQLINGRK